MTPRGLSSDAARRVRQEGHDNARLFALLIGMDHDYLNDPQAKKDVIDPSGDAHSVKSGEKKWQVFLYSRSRFDEDPGFQGLNGIGQLLVAAIDAFPEERRAYLADKLPAKERLRAPMRELRERLRQPRLLRAFLSKAIFNSGEVQYLTVLHEDRLHVFHQRDVVETLVDGFEVLNSKSAGRGGPPEQKVIFKSGGYNVAELEMRNDPRGPHYREIRLNMLIPRAMGLLLTIEPAEDFTSEVVLHGRARRTFGRWPDA